jgi:aspartate 1-decarboxylase
MALSEFCKSKIHGATITEANLNYTGSITVDSNLLTPASIRAHEKVQVVNLMNGERLETYIIEGRAGSGVICLNGPAARCAAVGDNVHIISYHLLDNAGPIPAPKVLMVNGNNRPKKN